MQANASMHQEVNNLNILKDGSEENNLLTMQPPTVIPKLKTQSPNNLGIRKLIPITQMQFNEALSRFNSNKVVNSKSNRAVSSIKDMSTNTVKKVSNVKATTKVPILKITINKQYNKPPRPNLNESKNVLNVTKNISHSKTNITNNNAKTDQKVYVPNIVISPKPVIFKLIPIVVEKPIKCENTVVETKNTCTSKIAYTRKGELTRDYTRIQTSTDRIRYLYTKAQRDCDVLRIRLKALRERHKQEEEEIKKLQTHLDNHYRNTEEKSCVEISTRHFKRKRSYMSSENPEEKDEYEKLLREVRKIKQDILNPKYPVTASNIELEQTNIFNHNESKIRKEYKRLIINNMSEANVMKSRQISTKIYNNDFKKTRFNVKSSDIVIPKAEQNLELVFMES
ncbi:uncharacterized protein LOC143343832 [Colletes latitarsis]|uniref:uncharacterized protein LOC143343832 n=1 Tax=Colletes latitarsis TaxID=2605962 RepID=UPI0040373074